MEIVRYEVLVNPGSWNDGLAIASFQFRTLLLCGVICHK